MPKMFSTLLHEAILAKHSALIVGLDPRLELIPKDIRINAMRQYGNTLEAAAAAVVDFNKNIIEAVCDIVPAVKPQLAFYELLGVPGIAAFKETVDYAKKNNLLVVADGKRNDIGSTAAGYSDAYLGWTSLNVSEKTRAFATDALTVNAYLGSDGVKPLIDSAVDNGTGLFILVKTSNPSSSELQNLVCDGKPVYEIMGELVHQWGIEYKDEQGYSPVGAVVGATFPAEAERLRRVMPHAIFLVPGFGAQGGGPRDVVPCFNADGLGAIVNSSRDVIFAYKKRRGNYKQAARDVAQESSQAIYQALVEAGKRPW